LRPQNIDGARVQAVLDQVSITANKNAVPGDTKPFAPGGIRLGSPALTTRGLGTRDFEAIAEFLHRGVQIALEFQAEATKIGTIKKLAEFEQFVRGKSASGTHTELNKLRSDVHTFASKFPMPGV